MKSTEEQVKEYFTDGLNITPDGFVEIQEGIFYSCMARFAERYAKQSVNAKLEEAAEKAKMKIKNSNITFIEYYIPHKDMPLIIDKESILSLKLQ